MSDHRDGSLNVRVVRDHDDECRVVASIRAGAYGGRGEAWLHIEDVWDFAKAVKRLADTSAGEAKLYGAFVKEDGTPDPTIDVRLAPHGRRGHVRISADLWSGPPGTNMEPAYESRLSTTIVVEPAGLSRFADGLMEIPKGADTEATVAGISAA